MSSSSKVELMLPVHGGRRNGMITNKGRTSIRKYSGSGKPYPSKVQLHQPRQNVSKAKVRRCLDIEEGLWLDG